MDRKYHLEYIVNAGSSFTVLANLKRAVGELAFESRVASNEFAALTIGINNAAAAVPGLNAQLAANVGVVGATSAAVGGMTADIVKMGAQLLLLQGGLAVLQSIGEKANAARDAIHDMAAESAKLRDEYRELGTLTGANGPDDQVIAETLKTGIQTGMTPDEARQFREQYLGSIEAGRQKGNIAPELESDVQIEGAKFGTRVKIAPKTAGDLTGVLPQYAKIESADDAARTLGQIEKGLQAGRGNMEPLVRSLVKTAGSVVGENAPFQDLGTLAAVIGVSSTHAGTGREAGTLVKQASMSMRMFEGQQGDALRDAGITPQDDYVTALHKLAVPIKKAQAEGIAPDQWLMNNGWGNKDEIFALKQNIDDLDVIDQRVAIAKGVVGADVRRQNEAYFTTEIGGMERRNNATVKANEFVRGRSAEEMESQKKLVAVEMINSGKMSPGWDWSELAYDMGGLKPMLGWQKTRERRVEEETLVNAAHVRLAQLRSKGLDYEDLDAEFPEAASASGYGLGSNPKQAAYELDEKKKRVVLDRLMQKIRTDAAPADVQARAADAVAGKLDALIDESKKTNQILAAQASVKRALEIITPAAAFGMGVGVAAAVPARAG